MKKNRLIEVWRTSMYGTYSCYKYKAKNNREAISKAKKEFGKTWTYYVPKLKD